MIKKKIEKILKETYEQLCDINHELKKKFSLNIKIKGKNSEFDSVDIVTFFSILDNNFKKNKIEIPQLLDDKFFFNYKNIKVKDLILFINEKK